MLNNAFYAQKTLSIATGYLLDLEVRCRRAKEKNMPRLPLLSAENKNKNEINRISHYVFDLLTLTYGSIFLTLLYTFFWSGKVARGG